MRRLCRCTPLQGLGHVGAQYRIPCAQGTMHGPDVGHLLHMLALEDGDVADRSAYIPLADRMERLRTSMAALPVKAPVAA